KRAGFVGGRQYDAAPPIAPDDDRLAAKRGIVTLLHRRIERVHVDVEHGARPCGHGRRIACARRHAQSKVHYLASRPVGPGSAKQLSVLRGAPRVLDGDCRSYLAATPAPWERAPLSLLPRTRRLLEIRLTGFAGRSPSKIRCAA